MAFAFDSTSHGNCSKLQFLVYHFNPVSAQPRYINRSWSPNMSFWFVMYLWKLHLATARTVVPWFFAHLPPSGLSRSLVIVYDPLSKWISLAVAGTRSFVTAYDRLPKWLSFATVIYRSITQCLLLRHAELLRYMCKSPYPIDVGMLYSVLYCYVLVLSCYCM